MHVLTFFFLTLLIRLINNVIGLYSCQLFNDAVIDH